MSEAAAHPPVAATRAFLPARDFETSKAFYRALGFFCVLDGDVAVFDTGAGTGTFIVQNYYVEDWAKNCMMQLVVDDVDAWWAHVQSLDLPARFGVPEPKPPALQPWGLTVAYFVDPPACFGTSPAIRWTADARKSDAEGGLA